MPPDSHATTAPLGVAWRGVRRVFGGTRRRGDVVALDGLDLEGAAGELLVLVGPSGSGKSTALRAIAGLEEISGGHVELGGRDLTGVPAHQRDVAMVFQDLALFPHLTVAGNILFGAKVRSMSPADQKAGLEAVAAQLDLSGVLDRHPSELSGGQRQRVALARAMVRQPAAFLLDEPLSSLDAQLRLDARGEIIALQRRLGVTMVYVTHDQAEAMTMGDRIAVLRDGRLQQVGTPRELYDRPATTFVAGFLGTPPMNLLPGDSALAPASGAGVVGVRPEDLLLAPDGPLEATVIGLEDLGSEAILLLDSPHGRLHVRRPASEAFAADEMVTGSTVRLVAAEGRLHRFGEDGTRLS